MRAIVILFLVVFGLNLVPAFAPPTWIVFSYIGFRYVAVNVTLLALVGALAATLGRMALAKMARVVIRQRFLSDATRENIDAIREHLDPRRKLTFGVFLFYAFTPLPSNYLFIAYGLTTMRLRSLAIPFFLGRSVSYSFWGLTASAVARRITLESTDALSYLSVYFVASQLVLLALIYVFTRVDWRALFTERKLRWTPKKPR
jgi:membrane protein DedA with SNARE-associated domain